MINRVFFAIIIGCFFSGTAVSQVLYELKTPSDFKNFVKECPDYDFLKDFIDQGYITYEPYPKFSGRPDLPGYYPYVKLYKDSSFTGEPVAELSRDGLSVDGIKKCDWNDVDKLEKNYKFLTPCNLLKIDKEKKSLVKGSCCDEFGTPLIYKSLKKSRTYFPIVNQTYEYFELKSGGRSLFMDAKKSSGYRMAGLYNKLSLEKKDEFLKLMNPKFKVVQERLIDFFKYKRECLKSDKSVGCYPLSVSKRFIRYLCYEKLIKCGKSEDSWVETPKIRNLYKELLDSCFVYGDMFIDTYLYNSSFKAIKSLNKYGGDLSCEYTFLPNPVLGFGVDFNLRINVRLPWKKGEDKNHNNLAKGQDYKIEKKKHAKFEFCSGSLNQYKYFKTNLFDKSSQKFE